MIVVSSNLPGTSTQEQDFVVQFMVVPALTPFLYKPAKDKTMTPVAGKVPRLRELTDDDVLLGRGFPAIENEGNVRFRELVRTRSGEYHAAYRRHTKDSIAREVVNTIHRRNGRFLTQVESASQIRGLVVPAGARIWTEADEAVVLIKAKQALRDHSDDSKESKHSVRRRAAAGSGNVVLEWVELSSSSVVQTESATIVETVNHPPLTLDSGASHFPSFIGSGNIPQQQLSSLLSTQQLSVFNQSLAQPGGFSLMAVSGGTGAESPAAALLAAASQQSDSLLNPLLARLQGQNQTTPAFPSPALQALMMQHVARQGQDTFQREEDATRATSSLSLLQNSAPMQIAEGHYPDMDLLEQRKGVPSLPTFSRMKPDICGSRDGSKADMAINKGVENAKSLGAKGSTGYLSICGVEVCLLRTICSFGLPCWRKETAKTAFTDSMEGSFTLTWANLGKQILTECHRMGTACAFASNVCSDARSVATTTIFLVGRCLDYSRSPLDSGVTSAGAPGALYRHNSEQMNASNHVLIRLALQRWGQQLENCVAFDGSFLGGTIRELIGAESFGSDRDILHKDLNKQLSSTSASALQVSCLLSNVEFEPILATIATLLRLQWVFTHPASKIFSTLAAQGGDTSRDYLLLKGVLEHGLAHELDFRIQGSSMTRSDVEDRIFALTEFLFKQFQDAGKTESANALTSKYSHLLGM